MMPEGGGGWVFICPPSREKSRLEDKDDVILAQTGMRNETMDTQLPKGRLDALH